MNLKRILALLCVAAMALALFAGCTTTEPAPAPPPEETGETPAELQLIKPGTLTVGTEIGYPPFEMYADDGVTELGLDIDLAKKIGEILGVEVVFQNTDFEGILDGLGIDKYDVVMSAVTITAPRAEKVDFSNPYIENWQAIVVKKGSDPITAPEQLDGLKVAYQKATTSTDYLTKLRDTGVLECQVSEYEKVMDCFSDLKLGRVDAVLCDSVVAEDYADREPENFEVTWVQTTDDGEPPELFGIGIKKGNAALLEAVNAALAQLEESGWLDDLRQQWLA